MIKALGNRVIIKPDEEDSEFDIPDSAKGKPVTGVVVSTGPKVDPLFIKPGDKVAYSSHAIQFMEAWGEKITFVREDDVICAYSEN